jgi:small multidrug resistance pump
MDKFLVVGIGIGLALITALGDALIKSASGKLGFSGWKQLVLGAIIYAGTALGWFFVLRKIKLSSGVMIYTLSLILFVVLISVFYFNEDIRPIEYLGIGMAIASLLILSRFA